MEEIEGKIKEDERDNGGGRKQLFHWQDRSSVEFCHNFQNKAGCNRKIANEMKPETNAAVSELSGNPAKEPEKREKEMKHDAKAVVSELSGNAMDNESEEKQKTCKDPVKRNDLETGMFTKEELAKEMSDYLRIFLSIKVNKEPKLEETKASH